MKVPAILRLKLLYKHGRASFAACVHRATAWDDSLVKTNVKAAAGTTFPFWFPEPSTRDHCMSTSNTGLLEASSSKSLKCAFHTYLSPSSHKHRHKTFQPYSLFCKVDGVLFQPVISYMPGNAGYTLSSEKQVAEQRRARSPEAQSLATLGSPFQLSFLVNPEARL